MLYKHSRESIPVLPFSLWGYIATKFLRESLDWSALGCSALYIETYFFLSLVILSLTSYEHGTLENKTTNCVGINFEIFFYNVPLLQWSRETIPVLDRGSIYLFAHIAEIHQLLGDSILKMVREFSLYSTASFGTF